MTQPDILSLLEAATHEPASSLHFMPARPRPRLDGWTEARQRRFVAALAATGHAGRAADLVGMTEQSARRLRRRSDGASFGEACGAAVTFARQTRSARAAAARKAAKGSQGAKDPRGEWHV